uniref:Uncharacterized protein n=1 Tax=Avena sativa TaxID=4498 RepID=A0ACD5TWN2_AVESA
MDGNAALWLKEYKLRHAINTCPELMTSVNEKFGSDDYRRHLKQLLAFKQRGSVAEYQLQFEALSYQIFMQNPHYDEQFFVSQFIKGWRSDIRGTVEAQVLESVEREIVLALVQEELLAEEKPWAQKQQIWARPELPVYKQELLKPVLKMGAVISGVIDSFEITYAPMIPVSNVEQNMSRVINVPRNRM